MRGVRRGERKITFMTDCDARMGVAPLRSAVRYFYGFLSRQSTRGWVQIGEV